MAFERSWPGVTAAFTADGTVSGRATVADTTGLYARQTVTLSGAGLPTLLLQVKGVFSATGILLGPISTSMDQGQDISAYTLALGSGIVADPQPRYGIDFVTSFRAIYAEEPAAALRVMMVDRLGNPIGGSGPTSDVNVAEIGGVAIMLGQEHMADSIPVVLADDQSPIPVTVTFPVSVGATQVTSPWVVSGSVGVSGTVDVGNFPSSYDVVDRAARLLGVVYGSQGQKLLQSATNYNLVAEIAVGATLVDPRQVRALSSSTDSVSAAVTGSVSVSNFPASVGVTQGTSPWAVSGSVDADVTDRAGRLLGAVYGSQGQKLRQSATDYNLVAEVAVGGALVDPRSIRALTSSDIVDVSDRAARVLGLARLQDGGGNAVTSQASGSQRALDVGIDVAGAQVDPRQVRALAAATDAVTAILKAGGKGATVTAEVTSTAEGADHQAADVQIYSGGAAVNPLAEATFTGRVGEAQAAPTANTVLARLKDLLTGIVLAAGANNIGDVDVASCALPAGAATSANQVLGKTGVSCSVDFTAGQTGTALWTPTVGKRFVITDYDLSFTAAGVITLFDGTDDTAHRVFKVDGSVTGGAVHAYSKPRNSAAVDSVLKWTTGAGAAGSLTVWGYEE